MYQFQVDILYEHFPTLLQSLSNSAKIISIRLLINQLYVPEGIVVNLFQQESRLVTFPTKLRSANLAKRRLNHIYLSDNGSKNHRLAASNSKRGILREHQTYILNTEKLQI